MLSATLIGGARFAADLNEDAGRHGRSFRRNGQCLEPSCHGLQRRRNPRSPHSMCKSPQNSGKSGIRCTCPVAWPRPISRWEQQGSARCAQHRISRQTAETEITVEINLDGTGSYDNQTGVGFFDHMLDQLSRHSLIDMTICAKGDYHIDDHHTVEDTGIALGQALTHALGDKKGIRRYGACHLPMDDAQVRCALGPVGPPLSGLEYGHSDPERSAAFDTELVREFFHRVSAPMAVSPCIWISCTGSTATTSSKPGSKRLPARCAKRWRPIHARRMRSPRPKARCKC